MAKLRFEIKGESSNVSYASFVYASARFLGLLREIDQGVSGQYHGSLRWYVDTLRSDGALTVDVYSRLKPPPKSKRNALSPDFSGRVAGSLVTGFDNVQNLGVSPPYLTEHGLQNLSKMLDVLGKNGATAYRATDLDDGRSVTLSAEAAETVRQLIPTKRQTVGSVEGKLEAISIRKERKFIVYDALTDKAISCLFDNTAAMLELVKSNLGKRVLASGLVHWNVKSEPKRVEVEDIRVLGADPLPTTRELAGAYPNITDGMTTEEYIRSIRGD